MLCVGAKSHHTMYQIEKREPQQCDDKKRVTVFVLHNCAAFFLLVFWVSSCLCATVLVCVARAAGVLLLRCCARACRGVVGCPAAAVCVIAVCVIVAV